MKLSSTSKASNLFPGVQSRSFSAPGYGPFALGLALQNSQLRSGLRTSTRRELAQCLTPLQLAAHSTEDILSMLRQTGSSVSVESFCALARERTSACSIADDLWRHESITWREPGNARRESMVYMAAVELWRRLLPDRPCAELLAERIEEGYRLYFTGGHHAAREIWLDVWRTITSWADENLDLEDMRLIDSPRDLWSWHDTLGIELAIAAVADPDVRTDALSFFSRSIELFSADRHETLCTQGRLAGILWLAGQQPEARQLFQSLVEDHPHDAEALVWFAEALFFGALRPPIEDLAQAETLLKAASDLQSLSGASFNAQELLPVVRQKLTSDNRTKTRQKGRSSVSAQVKRLRQAGRDLPSMLLFQIAGAGVQSVPQLLRVLEDEGPSQVVASIEMWAPVHAAELLSRVAGIDALEPLLRRLKRACTSGEEELRCGCVQALARLGPAILERVLAAHHRSGTRSYRDALRAVMSMLGVHDDRIYALLLGDLANSPMEGAERLQEYQDVRALPPLMERYSELLPREPYEHDDFLAFCVGRAIESLGGPLDPCDVS